ncbi:hypothetical protein BGX29_005785 [Mortierella sp. GBA35]|nr:hypothetical protein BGX23_011431 [Mortierella sp. AD031]KAF9101338.1 hypothetical protein BGX29_005785 [Mortierella sp. GBA35]KAG0219543.1 hypothetical protein BGX33_002488 [Mortierella sp. NVP41]
MGNLDLRRMRIWLVVLSFSNLVIITTNYGYQTYRYHNYPSPFMSVKDWAQIIFCSILFVAYVYSLRGKRVLEKHFRVFWMLIPCLSILGINFGLIDYEVKTSDPGARYETDSPFYCDSVVCRLHWSMTFISAMTGLFSLIEIGMAFAWGPLQPKDALYGRMGYSHNAQVMIVSPNTQPPMVYSQQPGTLVAPQPLPQQNYYYPQQQQQQQLQPQQPSGLVGPVPVNTPTGTGVNPALPYQFIPQQQQQFQSFTQPAPLQPSVASPSPQPSPGASYQPSTPGTQQHPSPAAVTAQPPTSA